MVTLATLPEELLTQVFCALPSFTDIASLSQTCHRLLQVNRENASSIYLKVAPQNILCYNEAYAAATAQGKRYGTSCSLSATLRLHGLAARLHANATAASWATQWFQDSTHPHLPYGIGPRFRSKEEIKALTIYALTTAERERFRCYFYNCTELIALPNEESRAARLRQLTFRRLYCLDVVSGWLLTGTFDHQLVKLGLGSRDDWGSVFNSIKASWDEKSARIYGRSRMPYYIFDHAPQGAIAVFDTSQWELEEWLPEEA